MGGAEAVAQEHEGVGGVQPVRAVGVLDQVGEHAVAGDLAHHHPVGVLVGAPAQPLQDVQGLRARAVVERPLQPIGLDRVGVGPRRVVPQQRVMGVEVDHVQAEAVGAAVEPEPGDVEHGLLDLGVEQVEVRLLLQEVVQIVLAPPRLPAPGRAAEHRQPVVGRRAVGLGRGPDVPVGLGVVPARPAFREPGALVGAVGIDLVDDDLEAQPVGGLDHAVIVGERAEHRVDAAVVRDVVAAVLHRRGEEGRDPDAVDAQAGDVVQLLGDAGQVADAVAIGVAKAARVDLIEDGAAPPLGHGVPPASGVSVAASFAVAAQARPSSWNAVMASVSSVEALSRSAAAVASARQPQ